MPTLTLNLSPEQVSEIARIAKEERISRSAVARGLVEVALEDADSIDWDDEREAAGVDEEDEDAED